MSLSLIKNAFKKLLKIESLDEDDDKKLEDDINSYTKILNSNKYADSNSDTEALERILKAAKNAEREEEQLKQDQTVQANGRALHEPSPRLNHESSRIVPDDKQSQPQEQQQVNSVFQPINFRQQFSEYIEAHLKLLEELEGEIGHVLPGQPVYQPAKFGKESGTNFVLKTYKVPPIIYECLQFNNYNKLGLMQQISVDSYVRIFQTLLWVEEAHQAIEMRRYDLRDVMLAKYEKQYFLVNVPGLAEGRPSLMRGDTLYIRSDKRASCYQGYIYEVRERDILIKLHESLHSYAMDGLRFDVSFSSSRTPFRRCHHGITQYNERKMFRDIVFPVLKEPEQFGKPMIDLKEDDHSQLRCFMKYLNEYQRKAVINVLRGVCRPAPYIIFGPPGTGKTVTMVEAVLQVYARKNNSKILVCGNSNSCADLLAQRIKDSNLIPEEKLVRVSAFYRMEKLVPKELETITKDMDMISAAMYSKYRVVVTTCIQSGALNEFRERFDYVFIDEAGHANEPEALISLGLMKNDGCYVLAGDPHQLGPVVISPVAAKCGLGTSLLERLSGRAVYQRQVLNSKMAYDERYITKLIISYRSDPRVLQVNNELFYHNELKFVIQTPETWLELLKVKYPLVFHSVKGRDRREYVNPSWFNANEAITVLGYVNRLYGAGLKPEQLGIITPYRRQIEKLNILFESCNLRRCKIATMEEFQGDEREVIIISTVRAREKNIKFDSQFKLGFLFDCKRFNVAVSRAKWLVIVVGDPQILSRDPSWKKFMEKAYMIEENKS